MKKLEYFAESWNIIRKDPAGKEKLVEGRRGKTRVIELFTKKFTSIHYLYSPQICDSYHHILFVQKIKKEAYI